MRNGNDEINRLTAELSDAKRELHKKDYLLKAINKRLSSIEISDHITGVYNKNQLGVKFREAITNTKRLKYTTSLCLIRLEKFSLVQKEHGQRTSDRLLIKFVESSKKMIRDEFDFMFRISDDQFVFLMPDCQAGNAIRVCERISNKFSSFTDVSQIAFGVVEMKEQPYQNVEYYIKMANSIMLELKSKKIK